MRKDIKSINEAYMKSTKGLINEDQDYEIEGAKSALDQIKDRLHYLSPEQLKELQSIIANELNEAY
jgi:predicted transcriptional regulator